MEDLGDLPGPKISKSQDKRAQRWFSPSLNPGRDVLVFISFVPGEMTPGLPAFLEAAAMINDKE